MPNMATIISRHNKAFLAQRPSLPELYRLATAGLKPSCPMKGQYRESFIIYKATLTTDGIAKNYYGCSETEFKTHFNHNQNFRYRQKS